MQASWINGWVMSRYIYPYLAPNSSDFHVMTDVMSIYPCPPQMPFLTIERKITLSTCFIVSCGRAECPYCSCSYLLAFGDLGHYVRKWEQHSCTLLWVSWSHMTFEVGECFPFLLSNMMKLLPPLPKWSQLKNSNLVFVWWRPNNVLRVDCRILESLKGCVLLVSHLWKIRIKTEDSETMTYKWNDITSDP